MAEANAAEWGRIELEETKIGRLDHKIEKLKIIKLVPGVEWLRPDARSIAHGDRNRRHSHELRPESRFTTVRSLPKPPGLVTTVS